MAEIKYTHLEAVLKSYGWEVAEKYKDNLAASGAVATATLYNTIRPELERTEDGFTLSLWVQDYWEYLERGTRKQGPYKQKGDPPPFSAILKWVQIKPIVPWNDKLRKMPLAQAQKSMAFAIRHSIWENGTKPQWFLRDSMGNQRELDARISEALSLDLEDYAREVINEITG